MKPWLSSSIDSASHSVCASAPIRTNKAGAASVRRADVVTSSTTTRSRRPLPSTSRTALRNIIVMAGRWAIRSIRYRDMLAARPSPRVTRVNGVLVIGQPNGRLTGRIAPADDDHRIAGHDLILSGQRRVEHPSTNLGGVRHDPVEVAVHGREAAV